MDGAVWVLIIAIIMFATILLIHHFVDESLPLARLPIVWFYASWLLGLFLLALPLFSYSESFNATSASYIIAILLSYSIGSVSSAFWGRQLINERMKKQHLRNANSLPSIPQKWIFTLLFMGLIGTSLLMLNTLLGGSLSLTDRFDADNFAAIRIEHMVSAESRIGRLYGPATLMSSIGGLGVAFIFYLRGSRSFILSSFNRMYTVALIVLACNIIIGLVGFGSRMFAVFSILIAFLAFAEGRWAIGERLIVKKLSFKRLFILVLSSVLALSILWAAATIFLEKRVQNQDPHSLLFRTHRASFSPSLYELTRDDKTIQYFMFSVSYLTTPIPTLVFYLDLSEARQPGPFFGEYNFPALARWSRRLTFSGDPNSWNRARYEIFKPLGDIGFGMNVWATLVRDLIADFTKFGALIFLGAFGFMAQRVFDRQREAPSMRLAGLLVYIRLILIFAGMISVLFMPQVHWSFYLAILLVVFAHSKNPKEKTSDQKPRKFIPIKRRI